MNTSEIPILILAAGQSTRMRGTDKLQQLVSGQPLIRHISRECAKVSRTFIALHHNAKQRLALLDGLPVTPLFVADAAEGQSGTLRGAVAQLPLCDAFMVVLADLPDLTANDLKAVIAAKSAYSDALIWRGATPAGKPGHPILFDARLRDQFSTLTGDDGGASIVRPLADRTVLVRFADDRALLDLDTPEQWDAWRSKTSDQE